MSGRNEILSDVVARSRNGFKGGRSRVPLTREGGLSADETWSPFALAPQAFGLECSAPLYWRRVCGRFWRPLEGLPQLPISRQWGGAGAAEKTKGPKGMLPWCLSPVSTRPPSPPHPVPLHPQIASRPEPRAAGLNDPPIHRRCNLCLIARENLVARQRRAVGPSNLDLSRAASSPSGGNANRFFGLRGSAALGSIRD